MTESAVNAATDSASPAGDNASPAAPKKTSGGLGSVFTGFLVVAVIGLTVMTLLLAKQNRELKTLLSQASVGKDTLKGGPPLGELTLFARDGSSAPAAFVDADRPTLLLVSSSKCPHCDAQMPIWDTLAAEVAKGGGVRILAIQADAKSAAEFKAARPAFDFVRVENPRSTWLGKLPGTPYTAVISTKGVLSESWPGEFGVDVFPQIRKSLDAALTGG